MPGTRHRMVQVGTDDLMPMKGGGGLITGCIQGGVKGRTACALEEAN